MHVQLVSRIFAPEPAAASFRLEALVKALSARGDTVDVYTTIPAPGTDRRAASPTDDLAGVRVRRVQAKRDKTGYIRGYLSYLSFDLPAFLRLLFAPAPDIYVAEPPPTTGALVRVLAALRRRPYLYYAADIWSDAAQAMQVVSLVVRVLRRVEAFALGGAAMVLVPTVEAVARARSLGARRVRMVRNGIDTEVFSERGEMPEVLGGAGLAGGAVADPSQGVWFVYAGTASEWQGAEVFVEAFARIVGEYPQARLLFIGQGSAWKDLQERAARVGAGRVFFGQVGPQQAAAWQRHAAAALVSIKPGTGYDSAYPTKVFSALACATPVIFAGAGPAAQEIESNRLGLALPWASEEVAQGMRRVLEGNLELVDLRAWALENCSLANTGRRAAQALHQAFDVPQTTTPQHPCPRRNFFPALAGVWKRRSLSQ